MKRQFIVRLLLIALSFASVSTALSSMPDAAVTAWYLFYSPVLICALSYGLRGAVSGSLVAALALTVLLSRAHLVLLHAAEQVSQAFTATGASAEELNQTLQQVQAAGAGLSRDSSMLLLSFNLSLEAHLLNIGIGMGLITISCCIVGWQMDEGRRREQRTYEEARTDSMTGLPNYRRLREQLELLLAGPETTADPFALMIMDIDHFKVINDSFGHLIGDGAIRYTADTLRASAGARDMVARYGGDEFAILLHGAGPEEAQAVGDRILASLAAEPFLPGSGASATVRLSIGVAAYPADGKRAESLIGAADDAMYHAKLAGGNQVMFATASTALAMPVTAS